MHCRKEKSLKSLTGVLNLSGQAEPMELLQKMNYYEDHCIKMRWQKIKQITEKHVRPSLGISTTGCGVNRVMHKYEDCF